jgi:hypothetical protein
MAQATVTILPRSVAFSGTTWDSNTGGSIEGSYTHSGRPITEWTGDALYGQSFIVDGAASCSCTIRDLGTGAAFPLGTKGDVVYIVTGKSGADSSKMDVTITLKNMLYEGCGPATQPRAAAGSIQHRWTHDSDDGTTSPI